MIRTYEPHCKPCRQALNVYYITCQGCQERRRKALLNSASNAPIPPASVPQPSKDNEVKAAILIDRWKLPIFTRHLKEAGFAYEEVGSVAPDVLTLTVVTDKTQQLAQVVLAATQEATKTGAPK